MPRISRFTPWQTPRGQLEAIFVAREPILDDLATRVAQAADTQSRIHTLLVGPRGAGKTHLLAMLYYRLQDAIDGGLRVQLARLPEDPFTVVSYPRLLGAILAAIRPGQPVALDATLEPTLDQLAAAGGPIVVLLENLDEVFAQIGVDGQRKLRHYLQTSNTLLLMATTSILDRSVSDQDSPFYGFFSVIRLQPLQVEQAQQMLINIARVHGDENLADYLGGERVKGRLEIVSRLAGSHPRIWSIFADVMTPGSLREIAALLYASFDDLAPYYRERLMSLTPQQRLVVGELAAADQPLHVQDLATRAQIEQRSAARAMGELREAGWVVPVTTPWAHLLDGRRTYYELAEPLARLAFQAKEAIARPIELIVNFLSVWFDPQEVASWGGGLAADYVEEVEMAFGADPVLRLTRRLTRLPESKANDEKLLGEVDDALASVQDGDAEPLLALHSQVRAAIERRCKESSSGMECDLAAVRRDLHLAAMDYMGWVPHEPQSSQWITRGENLVQATGEAEDLSIWSQWLARAWRFDQAETVVRLIGDDVWRLAAQEGLAVAYRLIGRLDEAIELHERTVEDSVRVLGESHRDTLAYRNHLAVAYGAVGRLKEAIELHERIIADRVRVLGADHPDTLVSSNNLAITYRLAGYLDEAIELLERTVAEKARVLGEDRPSTLLSRNNLAVAYRLAGRLGEAIELHERTVVDRGRVLGEDHPGTLTSRDNLAVAYGAVGRLGEAIELHERTVVDKVRMLGEDHPDTLTSRDNLAVAYRLAGRLDEAIELEQINANLEQARHARAGADVRGCASSLWLGGVGDWCLG